MQSYKFTFLLLLSLVFSSARSQETKVDSLTQNVGVRHYIRWSPVHLLNFYPTLQVAYEYRWGRWFGVQTEAGYVLPYTYDTYGTDFLNKKGLKAQVEFRYYFAGASPKQQHYTSAELYANAVNFNRETYETECFDAECTQTYSRRYFYQVKYRERGLTLKYGLVWYGKKLLLDVNWGLRLRFIDYKKPFFDQSDFWAIPNERKRTTFLPVAGMRIGWRLH